MTYLKNVIKKLQKVEVHNLVSCTEKTLSAYDIFLSDLIKYMLQIKIKIEPLKCINYTNNKKLTSTEKKDIKYNYKEIDIKCPKNIDISEYKKALLQYTRPNETEFPKLSKVVCRTNGIWLKIITFLCECNFFDFSIYFSEDEYKQILSSNKDTVNEYFADIKKYINVHEEDKLRAFFDYLYEELIDSDVFRNAYEIELSRTGLRKNTVEEQTFCPCCMLHETSTGNSQIDHFIPRSLAPFFSISSYNLIVSCPECNGPLVKGSEFLTPILHPKIDSIEENIKYHLDNSGVFKIIAIKNAEKTNNFCTQFKIEDRINANGPFDNKKNKRIFRELDKLKKTYLDNPNDFYTNIDKIYKYYVNEVSKKDEFFVKIVCDILESITDENSYIRKEIDNLSQT